MSIPFGFDTGSEEETLTFKDKSLSLPTERPTCGSTTGANAHSRNREHLCGDCLMAREEAQRRTDALRRGTGEFWKTRKPKGWTFYPEDPLGEWRAFQVKQVGDETLLAGPWWLGVRVPREELPDAPAIHTFRFDNGSAEYHLHHSDETNHYYELKDRKTIVCWLDVLEEKYL